jgi:4-hydroxybenzoate polyprenyltransferase
MNPTLKGYVRLVRPANLPTAAADILAGVAISGSIDGWQIGPVLGLAILALAMASVFLYGGGVVLNDVFDLEIDRLERPERPIPSGLISKRSATIFGLILLLLGILLAFLINPISGTLATILALTIILYDGFSKKYSFLGPLNMGLCRGLNLILGISILGGLTYWYFAVVPFTYIFAITLISRGEVHGNNKGHLIWAGILYAMVILAVNGMVHLHTTALLQTVPFQVLFVFMVYLPLVKAYKVNSPENIKKAVIAGVLSLILLDAVWGVGFSHWGYAMFVLLLLPLSLFLSKIFAVT